MSKEELARMLGIPVQQPDAEVVDLDSRRPTVTVTDEPQEPEPTGIDAAIEQAIQNLKDDEPAPQNPAQPEGLYFTMNRKELAKALTTFKRVISRRGGGLPVLSGLLVTVTSNEVTFQATDFDLAAVGRWTISAGTPGKAVIPVKELANAVAVSKATNIPIKTQTVEVEGGGAWSEEVIVDGATRFKTLNLADYPRDAPWVGRDEGFANVAALNAEAWQTVSRVAVAASKDDARPILTGLLFEKESDHLRVVATDSYRLAVGDIRSVGVGHHRIEAVIPTRLFTVWSQMRGKLALRDGVQTLRFDGRAKRERTWDWVSLETDTEAIRLYARLIDGDYPNYRQLIPAAGTLPVTARFDYEALRTVMNQAKPVARDTIPVQFVFAGGRTTMRVVTANDGSFQMAVPAATVLPDTTDWKIAFNWRYLSDGLDACGEGTVEMGVADPLKPALLGSEGDRSYTYLVMPVRL